MANVFDQFDEAETRTAPAPSGSPKGTPFVTENANPFDRFDAAEAAPGAVVKEDLGGQFGAGLVKGIPNAVTGLADLTEKGVADNLLFRDPRTGRSQFEAVVDAWGDVFSGKETPLEVRSPYKPVSGDIIRKGLDMARLNPDDYFRAPATPGERMAEMAGEGAITSVFSPNKAQGLGKLIQLGRDMIIGGGAGAAAQAGMELAPDEWDPLVGLGAGLAGGIGTAAATAVPGAMLKGLGAVGRYVEPAVAGKRGIERMAGKKLAGIAGDVPSTIEALNAADEIVPGSRPTSFQASGNVGLGSLEAALARSDDEFKGKLIERREQQNAARIEALEEIQDTGNPGLVADYFRDRMADLERTADDLYSVAERKAQTEFEGLGNRPAGEIGDQARSAIEAEFKRLNRDANQLWESIDPDGTLVVSTAPIRNAAAKMYAEMAPEDVMSLSAKEKALANIIGEYGDTIPFQRFKSLRTQINEAMRQARMSGENIAAGRLSQLRSSIEDAVGESIAGKMQADPSKAEEFVRQARDWYENRVGGAASAAPRAGAVGAAGARAPAVPEAPGAGGAAGRETGAPAGGAGLPEDAAARRAVEGGGRYEQGANEAVQSQRESFRRYMRNRTFKTREEAESTLRYYIDKWNKPDAFGPPKAVLSYGIIDELLVKRGKGFAVSNKGLKPKPVFEASSEPIGEAPDAAWGARDMQDYRKTAKADEVVDELYVSLASIPKAKLAGGRTGYDWSELERGGAIPPVTLRRNKNGSVSIIDGNHRIEFFRERGYDSVPAYVIRDADEATSDRPMRGPQKLFQDAAKATQTDLPAFKRWFGDSKVVDGSGKPLVVYHGTDNIFDAFAPNQFFTSSEAVAGTYGKRLEPVYLSIKNPLVVEGGGKDFSQVPQSALFDQAKRDGHDGLIVRNIIDDADGSVTEVADNYIPFDPKQVKSTSNRGTFDPNDPRILFQSGTVSNPGAEFPRPFYSAALKSVEDSKTNRASPQQWAATIKNTPGVKQEELDWLGLTPWLAAQKGPVTKEQIADFIRANQIEVEEVNLSGDVDEGFEVDVPRHFDWEPDDIDEDFVRELAREDAVDQADDLREQVARREDIEPEDVTDDQIEQQAFENQMRYREQEPDGYHTSVVVDLPDGRQAVYDVQRSVDGYTNITDENGDQIGDGRDMDEDDIRSAIATHIEESFERPAGEEGADGPTQYGEYTLPGGKDYHELLLKLPERSNIDTTSPTPEVIARHQAEWDKLLDAQDASYAEVRRLQRDPSSPEYRAAFATWRETAEPLDALHKQMVEETRATQAPWRKGKNFEAPHYDDQSQNILAHVRFKDRTSVDGKRTLFLEEVQSDWHQQGRDKGYRKHSATPEEQARVNAAQVKVSALIDEMQRDFDSFRSGGPRWKELTAAQDELRAAEDAARGGDIPDAPFKTTWPELALKRMIRWAADNGYDQIAWTPGSVQNARYNLSQHINNVQWFSGKGDMAGIRQINLDAANRSRQISLVVDQEGKVVGSPQLDGAINKPLSEVVGKDLAQQIMSDAEGQISKAGLAEIGGSGMREFYDRVLVSLGNKLGKKFNTQVGKSQIRVRGQRGDEYLDVPALPITPEMRAGALRGQPLFQKVNEAATSPLNDLPQPTEAQKEAGNYKKGHVRMGGLDLSIENPAGSKRSGTDASGKAWSVDMKDHYGYIKGTTGRDKDHLDVFVSRNAGELNDGSPVFVVNQIDPKTGKFDEHKLMLGYPNQKAAEAAYKANYAKDWKGMGSIIPASLGELKQWIAGGNTKQPFKRSTPYAEADVGRAGVRGVPGAAAPTGRYAGREADGSLRGLPRKIGNLTASAYPDAQRVAAAYMKSAGLEYRPPNTYAKVDPERATRIAAAYDAMEHNPSDPAVQRAYKAMADETLAQYQAMLDDGMKIEFIKPGQPDPYAGNPRNMTEDVRKNKHMWVFATRDGFGSDATFDASDNPLLAESDFKISGQPATVNDIFRAVHDYFGHVKEGVGFRADGEENAWRAHSAMYSPEARRAMTSETRGQNSWVNYGPYGETNRTARSEDTHYADQKIGLLPEWVISEGAGDDTIATTMAQRFARAGRPEKEAQAAGQLVDAFYTTLANRTGKTVDEITDVFPLPRVRKDDEKIAGGLQQGPRGSIELGRGKSPSLISLFEKSDASTALHESAHQFLDMFSRVAGEADAPKELKQDWGATRAWWQKNARALAKDAGDGVTPADVHKALRGERLGGAKDAAVARGMHEQWARAFEVYLRDGKAPNAAMKGLFDQFKDWLTQVYRSLTGMNVNVSPDIRGVFDRMLGGAEAPAPGELINKAAADRFKAASAATRNIKETFGAKPVKGIVSRPGGPTYPYAMSSEGVSNQLFKPGAEGAANIQSVLKASNNAAAAREAIEAAAVLSAKRAAGRDGVLDPAKFDAWRAKHADALRQVPALDRRFSTAKAATEAMVEMGERRAAALDGVRKSAVGKLLKVEDGADVASTVGAMLNRADAVKSMRELVAQARGDQNALDGLRRAVVDHMLTRLKTPKDALRADTFQRYLGKNAPALAQVLEPEQMAGLRAIAQDLKRATQDVRAPGGGSPTAEYLAAQKRYGLVKGSDSVIGAIIRRALASAAGWAAGHTLLGPIYGPVSSMASFLGDVVLNRFREAGIKRVDDLIKEAILDPELMKALLMKAPREKGKGSAVTLGQRLANIAVTNLALSAGQAQEKEPREVRRRAQDDSITTPMLGVRG